MEAEDPAVVDDAVDDRGGHVPVAEHVAPSAELEVRGEDDAAGLVAVRDNLEQKPGPVDVDRQVAQLVDDQQPGAAYPRAVPRRAGSRPSPAANASPATMDWLQCIRQSDEGRMI